MIYICNNCGYQQDFPPIKNNMDKVFPLYKDDKEKKEKLRPNEVKSNQCPSCDKENAF